MRQWIRSHLTFANIVSLAALFVALGGTATAVTYVVSPNSQIGPGTVSGHKPPTGKHANIIGGSVSAPDIALRAVGPNQLGLDSVVEGNSDLTVPGGTFGGTQYPLNQASWTQQPGEVDLLVGQVNYTAPNTCTGPGIDDPWGEIDVSASSGGSVSGNGTLVRQIPQISGQHTTAALTAGGQGGPLVASVSSTATTRTVIAKVFTFCQDSGEDIVVHSMRFDLIRLR